MSRTAFTPLLLATAFTATSALAYEPVKSERLSFCVEAVASGMRVPSSLAFIDDTHVLVGDREPGILRRVDVTDGTSAEIDGLPEMLRNDAISSGLFDIELAPDFSSSGQLYLVYGVGTEAANGLAVSRAKLSGDSLIDATEIFRSSTPIAGKWHFGGRLVADSKYLYVSTGDGYDHRALAQDPHHYAGKILRLLHDGKIPADNPYADGRNGKPEVWAVGVRNPQGMAIDTRSGVVYINEHGPQGGDEINIVQGGHNYGWPIITYGEEYGGGPIGEGITHAAGMAQPLYYWTPSIAPSGLLFYDSKRFPQWRGNLFSGALAKTHLNRLVIEEGRVIHEERLLGDRTWRVRAVEQSPSGDIYIGVDGGQVMRLTTPGEDNQCATDQAPATDSA